ncbi:MAG: hypothetical protein EBU90_18120 [Proteobacteria bacterium]|nr:hypothetical protein [Pseudomonadota bacterium]NBP14623.1 hypothetical protein [bacterium]
MKFNTLAIALLVSLGLAACSKPDANPPSLKEEPKKEAPMLEASAKAASTAAPAEAPKAADPAPAANTAAKDEGPGKGEMKEVCTDKMGKDGKPVIGKDGKPEQKCEMIKVRKKLEGTEIPPAKK